MGGRVVCGHAAADVAALLLGQSHTEHDGLFPEEAQA